MSRLALSCVSIASVLALASTALADPPTQSAPIPIWDQPLPDPTAENANDQSTSNQAGPVENNTNTGGLTSEGNVIDRTGQSRRDPSKFTAPWPNSPFSPDDKITWAQAQGLTPLPPSRWGLAVAAGGGATGFTNQTLRDTARTGGEWDVRVTFGTRTPLAAEATYSGSAQTVDALGVQNATLVGNGVSGAIRLNALVNRRMTPFVYAGVAWRHYSLTHTAMNLSDVSDSDDVMELPVGAGASGRWGSLVVDARAEFRASVFEDLMEKLGSDSGFILDANDDHAGMHRWGVNATVGYEF